ETMPQRREKKGPSAKDRRPIKKKTSILNTESVKWIDYKDVNLLRRFMSERAKIRARRVTGNDQQQQAAVAKAIKLAREMALLPYSVRHVTQRSKGRRDRGDRGDRGELRMPNTTPTESPEEQLAKGAEAVEKVEGLEGLETPETNGEAEATVAADAYGDTGDGEA